MGTYLNPGNSGFEEIRRSIYVDKSELIALVNQTIRTPEKLTCISRPRRFGKSFAAKMLCAYYDKTCDSSALFDDLAIAAEGNRHSAYRQHLNRYDVIYLDMTNIMGKAGAQNAVSFIQASITEELLAAYPSLKVGNAFDETLIHAVELTGNKFIAIIDEWDAPIRESPEFQKKYLEFLRTLFKGSSTTDKIFAAAYITGILPIKKDGSQSAISDFQEFSMIKPRQFGRYVGFTEEEVQKLCREHQCEFHKMKQWYDGYIFRNAGSIYNPNSVMKAIRYQDFDSYWVLTSAAESLMGYISLDYDGLSKTVTELIGGGRVQIDTRGFSNDLVTFRNKDDVLTLLIHLGYLAYEEPTGTVRIPNEEIRLEFAKMIRDVKHDDTVRRVKESDKLIEDTIHGNANAVAAQIEKIHAEESPLHYNNEQSLRSVIKRAYFSYGDEFVLLEELPSGDGYADIVYLPKKASQMPILLIELKWNHSAESAISQIKARHYPAALEKYGSEILLVGISYDKEAPPGRRRHTCIIEKHPF